MVLTIQSGGYSLPKSFAFTELPSDGDIQIRGYAGTAGLSEEEKAVKTLLDKITGNDIDHHERSKAAAELAKLPNGAFLLNSLKSWGCNEVRHVVLETLGKHHGDKNMEQAGRSLKRALIQKGSAI